MPNIIVSYGGRFQPAHIGHKGVYDALTKKFGKKNVYVTTSNKTDSDRSPLSFTWKQKLLKGLGIPASKIVQVKNNYKMDDLIKATGFKPEETIWITAVGQKDAGRLGGKYFKPYKKGGEMNTADQNGYVYIIPNIKVAGKVMSATSVRDILRQDGELSKKDYVALKGSTGMARAMVDQIRPLFEQYEELMNFNFLKEGDVFVTAIPILLEGGAGGH